VCLKKTAALARRLRSRSVRTAIFQTHSGGWENGDLGRFGEDVDKSPKIDSGRSGIPFLRSSQAGSNNTKTGRCHKPIALKK
jgi:hypothetical protein